jgi:GT2 family glycosyltransferase
MTNVFIIIPVHNRKITTLRCLSNLENIIVDRQNYKIIIVDDGSTDGTSQCVLAEYPEVLLLSGSGNLWWTGAIRLGMEYAYQQGAEYFVWLNDDTYPSPNTIESMIDYSSHNPNTIVSAQCYENDDLRSPTYGGQIKGFLSHTEFHTPLGQNYHCDCMSGNLVCFPISIIDKIGFPPSDQLPHISADIVYTAFAKKAGYDLIVCGNATAVCTLNPYEQEWSSNLILIKQKWGMLKSYKSNLYPPFFWYYCQKSFGFLAPVVFLKGYLSLLFFTFLNYVQLLPPLIRSKFIIFGKDT